MQKVVGGLLTNYEILGSGKTDLVILHGWAASGKEWLPIAEELKSRYRVILVDLPGFGGTQGNYSWGIYEYADWVEELFSKLEITHPVILGHSFGGRIGIILASRGQRLASRLVLVDAAGMEIKSWKVKVLKWLAPVLRPLPRAVKRLWMAEDYKSAGQMRQVFGRVVNQSLRDELKDIHLPTLIVWGDKDEQLSLVEAKMLKVGIKGSTLRIVWGAGHWPHLTKKDELLRVLEEENV